MWTELVTFLVEFGHVPMFGLERTLALPVDLSVRYWRGSSQRFASTLFLGDIFISRQQTILKVWVRGI